MQGPCVKGASLYACGLKKCQAASRKNGERGRARSPANNPALGVISVKRTSLNSTSELDGAVAVKNTHLRCMTSWNEALAATGGAARLSPQRLHAMCYWADRPGERGGGRGEFTSAWRVAEKPTLHQGGEREKRKKETQRCSHSCLDGGLNGSLERRRGKNARHMWRYALPHKRMLSSYGPARQIAPAVGRSVGNEMKCKQQMASFFEAYFLFQSQRSRNILTHWLKARPPTQ